MDIFQTRKKRTKFIGKAGDRFGRLTLTGLTYVKSGYGRWVRMVEVVCDCGEVKDVVYYLVASGQTQSCGCYRRDVARKMVTTHNLSNHLLYDVWQKMVFKVP